MDAVVVDIKDFGVRSPEQALRVFLRLYDEETVRNLLLSVFAVYGRVGELPDWAPDTDVGQLFDHLIAVTGALEQRDNDS